MIVFVSEVGNNQSDVKLKKQKDKFNSGLEIVMRTYFSKPRDKALIPSGAKNVGSLKAKHFLLKNLATRDNRGQA